MEGWMERGLRLLVDFAIWQILSFCVHEFLAVLADKTGQHRSKLLESPLARAHKRVESKKLPRKALKKLIKKLGKEFGPWTMLAVLLLENFSPVKGIISRLTGWLVTTCPARIKRLPAEAAGVLRSAARSACAATISAASAATGQANLQHTLVALCSALFLHYFAVPGALAAPFLAAAQAAYSTASSLRSRVVPFASGLLTGLGLAWILRLFIKLAIHLRIASFFRELLEASEPDGVGVAGRRRRRLRFSLDEQAVSAMEPPAEAPDHKGIGELCKDSLISPSSAAGLLTPRVKSLISASSFCPKPSLTWEAPSSRGSDALHTCQPMMKRRRSLLRRRACTAASKATRPDESHSQLRRQGSGSGLLEAPTSSLQAWQPVSSCRRCRWRMQSADLADMLLRSESSGSLLCLDSPSSNTSFEWTS